MSGESKSPDTPFELVLPGGPAHERRALVDSRQIPAGLSSLADAARHYQPSPELLDAINVALAVGAPLLLTGEPGTGKTQVSYYLAWYFGMPLFPLFVRSNTTAEDLFYRFDALAYLRAANDPNEKRDSTAVKRALIDQGKGPLWRAYDTDGTAVVLIDEIDKATRDFPNDLLNAVDQHSFVVPELGGETVTADAQPPIMVITSNSERRLPEPFLRRCIVHHIELTPDLVRRAVAARTGDFPHLAPPVREAALRRFFEIRDYELSKQPSTAELITWLAVLSARHFADAASLETCPLRELPALVALVKHRDDVAMLG